MVRILASIVLAAALAGTARAAPQPPAFRLDGAAAPVSYTAQLEIDPRTPRFEGEIRIVLDVRRATPVLWLNATNLEIDAARLARDGREAALDVVAGGEDFVGFAAAGEPLAPGAAVLSIRYHGRFEDLASRGLFREREGGDWYVLSQFESMSARRAFPCFDEPGFKTPWQLTIDAPAAERVVSNTPERDAGEVPGHAGWRRHVFGATPPLPSYLVALAVGPFDIVDGGDAGVSDTPLRYVAPRGRGPEAHFAREATPRLVSILEDYFGSPFPFAKLDSVAIPAAVHYGAMENAGMITYHAALLLARPFEDDTRFRKRYASVAAHEIAHQWVGDLVTLAWWDDTWLNESLATWMADKTLALYQPRWHSAWERGWLRRTALQSDRLASARRVRNPVVSKGDVYGAFDAITYQKGATVLAMFEAWIGPDRFRAGLRDYLAAHAHRNATAGDLFAAIGAASGKGDAAVRALEGFIDQSGAPQLDLALRCAASPAAAGSNAAVATLDVVQQRFRPVGSQAPDASWTTPACFRYAAGGKLHEQCAQIHDGAQAIALEEAPACPDWIAGNADGAGDYVTRYDAALERRLVEHLRDVPVDEAVAFAGDGALLARSGLLGVDAALARADALLHDPRDAARQGGVAILERLTDDWLDAAGREAKAALIARDVIPLAQEVGWVPRASDDEARRELRLQLMPFAARYERRDTLRFHARELAVRWLVRPAAIDAGIAAPVLVTAGRFANETIYARLESALARTDRRPERDLLIDALAAVSDPALRDRALALTLSQRLDGREAFALLDRMLDDELDRAAAFAFLRANFDAIVAKIPPDSAGYFATPLGALCTPADRQRFADFFAERAPRFAGGAKRYGEALESIALCIASRPSAPR